jgi:hypothetical protein
LNRHADFGAARPRFAIAIALPWTQFGAGAIPALLRRKAPMRNIAFIASLIGCLIVPDMVFAMPIAPTDAGAKVANTQIVPARGGCGPRRHRGPYGGCRWNRW